MTAARKIPIIENFDQDQCVCNATPAAQQQCPFRVKLGDDHEFLCACCDYCRNKCEEA